jgi:hypothetical protein
MPVLPVSPELAQILIIISVVILLAALAFAMFSIFRHDKSAVIIEEISTKVPDIEAGMLQATQDDASLELFKTLLIQGEEGAKKNEDMPNAIVKSFQCFSCSDLTIKPLVASKEQPIEISCRIANTGMEKDSFHVELRIDSKLVAHQEIELSPGSSKVVAFSGAENEPGEHIVEIGQLKGQFSVR